MPPNKRISNAQLIMQLLSEFDGHNTPIQVSNWINNQQITRSRGQGLVRAMQEAGLLERAQHGQIRLGSQAKHWFSHALDPRYLHLRHQPDTPQITLPDSHSKQQPKSLMLWNPALVEMVDTQDYTSSPPYHIGFANASLSNSWRIAMLRSLLYSAQLHETSIDRFSIRHAGDDPDQQIQDIDDLVSNGIDLLIISATHVDYAPLSQKLREVMQRGIPVLAVDRRPSDPESLLSFVTASDTNIGRISAIWLAEFLQGQGIVWMLSGLEGASPALRRQLAALQAFTEFPEIQVKAIHYTGWQYDQGYQQIQQLLTQYGQAPDAVWCDSGLQGSGSIQSFLDAGLPVPPHTGGDINQFYKLGVKQRVPFVAVDYPASMGARTIETTLRVLAGSSIPKRIETPLQIILPRGMETLSVKADEWAELYVDWNQDDDCVLSQGSSLNAELKPTWQEIFND